MWGGDSNKVSNMLNDEENQAPRLSVDARFAFASQEQSELLLTGALLFGANSEDLVSICHQIVGPENYARATFQYVNNVVYFPCCSNMILPNPGAVKKVKY